MSKNPQLPGTPELETLNPPGRLCPGVPFLLPSGAWRTPNVVARFVPRLLSV